MNAELTSPSPEIATTHQVKISGDRVVKTFTSWARGEHRREWRGLSLLHEYAPGLGPEPISADLDKRPPSIVMSRVPGEPLGTRRLTPEQVDALAAALDRMHGAVPASVLADVYPQDTPSDFDSQLREMLAACPRPTEDSGAEPIVREAFEAARRFIDSGWVERAASLGEPTPVFGINDGNLANFLWDAETGTVHVIDFESAGRNDRAFELADLAEHISLWLGAKADGDDVLARLELTDAERDRIRVYRPAFASFWLLRLFPGGHASRRNPPGTLEAQAARLLEFG